MITEWDIVGVLVILIGLFFTVGKPILGFNKTVTEILGELKNHEGRFSEDEDMLEKHEGTLQNHEIRIHDLEGVKKA